MTTPVPPSGMRHFACGPRRPPGHPDRTQYRSQPVDPEVVIWLPPPRPPRSRPPKGAVRHRGRRGGTPYSPVAPLEGIAGYAFAKES
jgi:hypothetical protein